MSGEFVEFGGVNPDLDPELAMALKVSAEEEQERRERQKQRQLVAGERGVIVVEDDSRDHRRTCSACPPSATRVNGAPPVFCASKVTGSAEVSVPADSGDQAVREALAAKLAVEGVNGSSSGSASAQVASPRRAARAVVDTDAELMEADNAVPNGEETEITDAMAAENAKCDAPSHHRAH